MMRILFVGMILLFKLNSLLFAQPKSKHFIISSPIIPQISHLKTNNNSLPDHSSRSNLSTPEINFPLVSGVDVAIDNICLESNYNSANSILVACYILNNGTEIAYNLEVKFIHNNHQQIGETIIIDSLDAGKHVKVNEFWELPDGATKIYCIVDDDDVIQETNETNNIDSLEINYIAGVPFVWQEVDGYCHYASQTMLFNYLGYNHTVQQTVELAAVPHSAIYFEDNFQGYGGIFISQAEKDIVFAGTIRNCETNFKILPSWFLYWYQLKTAIENNTPCEVGVDPYYLPQPDYDFLREYDIHSGHAVVVVGISDSAIIINDPGVGLAFGTDPPLSNPEFRGKNLVINKNLFKQAVKAHPNPFIVIGYNLTGLIVNETTLLYESLSLSIQRLSGDINSYDPVFSNITGYNLAFGVQAFKALVDDFNESTFKAFYDLTYENCGNDLTLTVDTIYSLFAFYMFIVNIGWDASAVFYETMEDANALKLALFSQQLSNYGNQLLTQYLNMVVAIYDASGDLNLIVPYLHPLKNLSQEITELEDSVLVYLNKLKVKTSVPSSKNYETILPHTHKLIGNFPNPFNLETKIVWQQSNSGAVDIHIYNILGREIAKLHFPFREKGIHHETWNGLTESNYQAASGLYFYRLEVDGMLSDIKKMILLK